MAKILVADDNSNVQRTVTQALANLGVEVIAVNNGEAAVRKLAEIAPDLVLADIFMPVRNGYEVCEYVKRDARFAHVPVILLAGAFDPFDEREAQRVGADGILKKPFVPPDPLITMVKTLLDRVMGERLIEVSVGKASESREAQSSVATQVLVHPGPSEAFPEPSAEELTPASGRVEFGEGEMPVAFGSLLETSEAEIAVSHTGTAEPTDDEQILTSQRDAKLGEPFFWRSDSDKETDAEETEATGSAEDSTELAADLLEQTPAKGKAEAEDKVEAEDKPLWGEESPVVHPFEPLELVHEEQEPVPPSVLESEPLVLDPAQYAPLTVDSEKAEELAANPLEWLASVPPVPSPSSTQVIPVELVPSEKVDEIQDPDLTLDRLELVTPELEAKAPVEELPVAPVVEAVIQKTAETPEDTVRSIPKPPAPKLDPPKLDLPKEEKVDLTATVQSSAERSLAQMITSAASTVPVPPTLPVSPTLPLDTAADLSASAEPDPALVEAVVQRVLDKMRPQVVDIITREFLRPVVQALVYREIEKH